MDDWKTSVLLGWPIFKGYVSFREGICSPRNPNFAHFYPNDSSILSHATGHTARLQDQRCAWNGDLAHQPVATSGRTKAKDPNLAQRSPTTFFRLNGAGAWVFSTERENWAGGFPRTNSAGKPMVSVKNISWKIIFEDVIFWLGWKKKRSRKQIPDNKIGLLHQDQLYSWFSSGCKYPLAKKNSRGSGPIFQCSRMIGGSQEYEKVWKHSQILQPAKLTFSFRTKCSLRKFEAKLIPPPHLWKIGHKA